MTTFYTADTHFRHARVIGLNGRPFRDFHEMDEEMVRRWNGRVGPEDTVWHLGDFAVEADDRRVDALFARLLGIKRLVPGNHDEHSEAVMMLPWASVERLAHVGDAGRQVVLCHYPLVTWHGARNGAVHLHGHMHGSLPGTAGRADVGVGCWDYAPVTLDEALARMRRRRPDPAFADGRARR